MFRIEVTQLFILNQTITTVEVKNMASLTDKQASDLCDSVGKMLVMELDNNMVKAKVKKQVADYVKKNKIAAPAGLAEKLQWTVKVQLKK